MSAAIIDITTREMLNRRQLPPGHNPNPQPSFPKPEELELARQILSPRSRFGPALGLTSRDLDRAQFRVERGIAFGGPKLVLKRALDIFAASLALVALVIPAIVIAIIIKLDDGGPVFFRQTRVGLGGQKFGIYKFRTMRTDAAEALSAIELEGDGPLFFKVKHDPRLTRVGPLLRKYALDEIPQLLNVLNGSMSLVGPRPPLPQEVESYDRHVLRRLHVKPGITGLWQVSGRSDLSWDESVKLDLYYVENWSIATDLVIVWRTVRVMLRPNNSY